MDSVEDFLVSPAFPFFYNKLKSLFNDSIAIGHSTRFDVQALNDTAKRYNLEPIKLKYLDIAEIYKSYNNDKNVMGLSKLASIYGLDTQGAKHTSLEDARITRNITLKLLEEVNLDLASLLKKIKMNIIENN